MTSTDREIRDDGILFPVHLKFLRIFLISLLVMTNGIRPLKGVEVSKDVVAIVEQTLELNCDITPPLPDDRTTIILWYRGSSENPLFSYDMRGDRKEDEGIKKSWSADEDMLNRTSFRPSAKGVLIPSTLEILGLRVSDEGLYRCRIDFKKSPTRNTNINVTVIVPPHPPTVMDEKGLELSSVVGPYNEGATLVLSCESRGGKPAPSVFWWRESTLVDESYEVTSVGFVRNDLLVQSLTRDDFRSVYRCEAANNNITKAVFAQVTVDMNLKPLEVRILQDKIPLSAEKEYHLTCHSSGSRPPPIMAWWLGNLRMQRTEESVSYDGNVTTSTFRLLPKSDDNGKYLSCRAENPTIPQSGLEDGWILDIQYAPIMSLRLGGSLKEGNIKEGEDVFFECKILANPWIYKVDWKFQGQYLHHNGTSGIIISNQSLVIQKVQRSNAGDYMCVGTNTEGEGNSQPIDLQIKHIPTCKKGQQMVYGVPRNEAAKITCEVNANPKPVNFNWTFNSSENVNITRGRSSSEGGKSVLTYIPRTEKDFGTLYCWASNEMGEQKSPCLFTLIPAGKPDPVYNCSVFNQSETSFTVRCLPGYNGGLDQIFHMDIFEYNKISLRSSVKHNKPEFIIHNVEAGTHYSLSVYAVNSKGRSEAIELVATTNEAPPKTPESESFFPVSPILGVLIGIVAAFTLVALSIVIVMKFRANNSGKPKEYEQEPIDRSNVPLRKDTDDGGENEEKSPDVIPSNNDHEFPLVEVKCLQKYGGGGGTLERKNNCDRGTCTTSLQMYGTLPSESSNHSSWSQSKKVRPYEDMQYVEMQALNNHRKMMGAATNTPNIRRDMIETLGIHQCPPPDRYPLTGSRRPFDIVREEEDVNGVNTPLMKSPHDGVMLAPKMIRRTEPETTAF